MQTTYSFLARFILIFLTVIACDKNEPITAIPDDLKGPFLINGSELLKNNESILFKG